MVDYKCPVKFVLRKDNLSKDRLSKDRLSKDSLNLRKEKLYSGKLKGIKGQYLIFEDSTVFNIRSNEGLRVEINIE